MKQQIRNIKLKDLVLWTENPRDPIDPKSKDQNIVDMALADQSTKWSITKLALEMGNHYDFSELPTVVFHGKKPVVYDGNRRVILGKIKHKLVKAKDFDLLSIPDFPLVLPCNVCTEEIALQNVLRKHAESGSWRPLERDMFLHKFMHEPKSTFLLMEENTGIISANNYLNQVFVKQEIFKDDILKEMGFEFVGEKLTSVHNDKQASTILSDLAQKIVDKKITTRLNRGKVFDVLDKKSLEVIDENKENIPSIAKVHFAKPSANGKGKGLSRVTRRRIKDEDELFGGKLYLNIGEISDFYRDINDLYKYYVENKDDLSKSFPSIIRMSLRLLCEAAATESGLSMDKYIKAHYANAKKGLTKNILTTLANQNVNEASMVQLLHTGAHNYSSSSNLPQTIAISIILGAMINITHGKSN